MSIPYTPNPGSIERFLKHIQAAGVPQKVTQDYLRSVGFKSSNDRYLIGILKAIDFLVDSGEPTKRWRDYRNKSEAGAVLAEAIRHGYEELFRVYPDAHRKDSEALRNFFASKSDLSDSVLNRAVQTFKALCSKAAFDESHVPSQTPDVDVGGGSLRGQRTVRNVATPSINLNIQLELPATENPVVYENLFAALRKHLLQDGNSS